MKKPIIFSELTPVFFRYFYFLSSDGYSLVVPEGRMTRTQIVMIILSRLVLKTQITLSSIFYKKIDPI